MFLADELPERDFQDWIDAYWAKDIQELFRLERHWSFQRFLELLFAQSGGMFEATRFAAPCEVSRQTISNYLGALEATFVVVAIECKWKADDFVPAALAAFRRIYPDGPSLVVATDVDAPYKRRFDAFEVEFVSLERLIERLGGGTA